jgi:hypothetical protein
VLPFRLFRLAGGNARVIEHCCDERNRRVAWRGNVVLPRIGQFEDGRWLRAEPDAPAPAGEVVTGTATQR